MNMSTDPHNTNDQNSSDEQLWEELQKGEELLDSDLTSDIAKGRNKLERIIADHPNTVQADHAKFLLRMRNIQVFGCSIVILLVNIVLIVILVN